MVPKIKPGDIVRYHGKMVRVMKCDPGDPDFQFKLSNFGWIHNHSLSNLELVNSTPDTILKDGDEVIIRDIPEDEKNTYGPAWMGLMDSFAIQGKIHTVTDIHYSDRYGWIGHIGAYDFQLYHVEPVNNFDIV